MTISRLRDQRAGVTVEQRDMGSMNYGNGLAYADPSAIPPHGWQMMQRAGVLVTPHSMLQVDVVFTALRIISNNIITMGNLLGYTKGYSEDNIPYKQWLRTQPAILTDTFGGGTMGGRAGQMMQCTGMDRTVWSMALLGEAFWYVLLRDKFERPSTIEVLHPAFMEVKVEKGVPQYIYGSGNDRKTLDLDNVIHVPLKSLPGARRSLNPVDYAGVAGALAMAAYEFGSSWFSQGAAPSFILSTDQKLGQDEVARIAEKFLVEHSGLSQAHLPLVLDSGVKATKALASPDEAQYLQTLEYARQVIGAWFGIPPSRMPNALQRQSPMPPHARQEDAIGFELDTLSGYTVPLEEVHSALLPANQFACFDKQQLSKPDAQFQAIKIQALRMTQVETIDEIRARELGMAPLPDGAGSVAVTPFASNVAPGQTGSTSPHPPESGGPPASDPQSDDDDRAAAMLAEQREMLLVFQREAERRGDQSPVTVNVQPSEAPRVENHTHVAPANAEVRVDVQPSEAPAVTVENHVAPAEATVNVENRVEPASADVHVDVQPSPAPAVTVENHVEAATPEIRVEPSKAEVRVENRVDVPPADVTVRMPKRNVKVQRDQRGRITGTEEE